MAGITERLRSHVPRVHEELRADLREAALELDRLRAENERLRADCEDCLMALGYIVARGATSPAATIAQAAIDSVRVRAAREQKT